MTPVTVLPAAPAEFSPTERALIQALVNALVRELRAEGVTTKAA